MCDPGGFGQRGDVAFAAPELLDDLNSPGMRQSAEKLGKFAGG